MGEHAVGFTSDRTTATRESFAIDGLARFIVKFPSPSIFGDIHDNFRINQHRVIYGVPATGDSQYQFIS